MCAIEPLTTNTLIELPTGTLTEPLTVQLVRPELAAIVQVSAVGAHTPLVMMPTVAL
jgi:hypothetical protein